MAFSLLQATGASAQAQSPIDAEKPALYYFVIDRSGSIITNRLEIPIRGALIQKLASIPDGAEVRMVMFNHRADRRRSWAGMDMIARGELSQWFDANFAPGGDTRLFDTVGEVLLEITEIRGNYSRIELTILSDGIEDPPISQRYRGWQDLESLSLDLKRSDPPFFGTWYTLGFTPPETPADSAGIVARPVPEPKKGFELPSDTTVQAPPVTAAFAVSRTSGRLPLRVEFLDRATGEIATYSWDFGDGQVSSEQNPVHVYERAGTYAPALRVLGVDGSEAASGSTVTIDVREPLPWWGKWLVLAIAAFVIWVAVIVPLFLKPAMLPHKGVALRGESTLMLRYLATKRRWNWLWPRRHLTVGGRAADDIVVVGAQGGKDVLAVVTRGFGSKVYVLKALRAGAVAIVRTGQDLAGNVTKDSTPVVPGKRVVLQDGKELEVGGKTFTWVQPGARVRGR